MEPHIREEATLNRSRIEAGEGSPTFRDEILPRPTSCAHVLSLGVFLHACIINLNISFPMFCKF
ncbi:hypothetical protein BDA96_02G075200 [Sorghum bicolor]|uniref:Uncharacterized protein n=1 Tax=Sorghum bicolor TaxID=4558 RepID=A0A921USY7_SORBI|nr:hypothetical protein BDA96_02G075200 [Sorghum bicolor]